MRVRPRGIFKIISPLVATIIAASPGYSDAKPGFPDGILASQIGIFGIIYAQSTVGTLSDSDLRRLAFYTDRTLDVLAASTGIAGISEIANTSNADALRAAVIRLIDAGSRSGLSQNAVADYFQLALLQRFTSSVPAAVKTDAGVIDIRQMFDSIAGEETSNGENVGIDNYVTSLNAESSDLDLGTSITIVNGQIGQNNSGRTPTPQPPEGADAETRALFSRLVVSNNGRWEIVVVLGDSLSAYAAAFYGDPQVFRQIYEANTNILPSINSLEIDQVIFIPQR